MSETPAAATPESPEAPEDLGFELPPPGKGSRAGVLVAVALVVGGGLAFGYFKYMRKGHAEPGFEVGGSQVLKVEVITPKLLDSTRPLSLPGTVRPLEEAKLYARVTGYVRTWKVDLGDKVTAGQVLAEIDTPDLQAELSQARAQLVAAKAQVNQAAAARDYSASNSKRYEGLADQNLVSRGQVEETQAKAKTDAATVSAAEATVGAMEANVRRLVELQGFSKVLAPFAGTISSRSIQRGALITTSATTPLFTVIATDPVRIYIDVPQNLSTTIKPGAVVKVNVREYGGKVFEGKVTRSAGALDNELHTMTTEVQVPNPDGALLPGMFVQASLDASSPHRVVEVPATALYSDAKGVRLATVDAAKRVHFVKIVIERDTGATVQVASGLTGNEQIIKIAVPTLEEGTTVETTVAAPEAKGSGPDKTGSGSAKP